MVSNLNIKKKNCSTLSHLLVTWITSNEILQHYWLQFLKKKRLKFFCKRATVLCKWCILRPSLLGLPQILGQKKIIPSWLWVFYLRAFKIKFLCKICVKKKNAAHVKIPVSYTSNMTRLPNYHDKNVSKIWVCYF